MPILPHPVRRVGRVGRRRAGLGGPRQLGGRGLDAVDLGLAPARDRLGLEGLLAVAARAVDARERAVGRVGLVDLRAGALGRGEAGTRARASKSGWPKTRTTMRSWYCVHLRPGFFFVFFFAPLLAPFLVS